MQRKRQIYFTTNPSELQITAHNCFVQERLIDREKDYLGSVIHETKNMEREAMKKKKDKLNMYEEERK